VTAPEPVRAEMPFMRRSRARGSGHVLVLPGDARMGSGRPVPPTRSVRDAAAHWARSIFGAPRNFADLVRSVQVRTRSSNGS